MSTKIFRAFLVIALAFFSSQASAILREFELQDGRRIKAEIIKYNSTLRQVDLKGEDGKVVRLKTNIFTTMDQSYISQWRKPPEGVVLIPAGTNEGTDPDFGDYSITMNAFYMDQYEVTRELWKKVHKWAISHGYEFDNPGDGKGAKYPAHTINWYDCIKWCNARSEMGKRTPCYTVNGSTYKKGQHTPDCNFDVNGFRIPTLEEWQYAARGGLKGKRFPWGDTISHEKANYNASTFYEYDDSSGCHPKYQGGGDDNDTSPVGSFPPNAYGLYDMVGNINEWNWDESKGLRSVRGCSSTSAARFGRCGAADSFWKPTHIFNGLGFRTVCK